MGALTCNRLGCNNVMCSRYSPTYGYLCNDCFEELVEYGLGVRIIDFMESVPGDYAEPDMSRSFEHYNKEFKRET